MRQFLRENGLSLTLFALFALCWVGQIVTGHHVNNEERLAHGSPAIEWVEYLRSGHFLEATTENWESEFLQMGMYVVLTVFLFQKGSSESKTPGEPADTDRDPRRSKHKKDAPWPVRRGGIWLRLYEYSLSIAFGLLFLLSFVLHAFGGAAAHNEEALHAPLVTALGYLGSSQFWFESFQNWQSEFLSIGAMVILSIFLRQRGSPESKPVDAPHSETGA